MSARPSRIRIRSLILLALGVGLVVWIARKTYWEDVQVPTPLHGEALLNPYYAAQHFAESLGARTERRRLLGDLPAPQDVLVLGTWHWDVVDTRRERLERWVESGGRLVVDRSLIGSVGAFSRWSGIDRLESDEYEDASQDSSDAGDCRPLQPGGFELCDYDDGSKLVALRPAAWSLRDEHGPQVLRIAVGRGSVTVINAEPFFFRSFLKGDHARLFVAATQLARGDRVHFLTERSHPNLLALLWMYGAPALCLGLAWVLLALWRNGVRLGPPIPPPETTRRSLGEQIRGTGRFVLRFGSGAALKRAEVRALEEAAARRIPGYSALPEGERAREVARLTHIEPSTLLAAIGLPGGSKPAQLRNAVELLETARRRISEVKKGL